MVKTCPTCGVNNSDDAKFCTSWGQDIANMSSNAVSQTSSDTTGNYLWCQQNRGFQEEEEGKLDS